ncbi:flavin reductase family protein [Rhodococcus sp. NPDC059968]|uniref:flavin reductase family protein n=1 Tax=Rhodococcus sp. NPDC059968 TaxID=3347017 RepID=UPI00366B39EC
MDAERYLLIAGGIGITPLLPMIEEIESRGTPWELVYGGRTLGSMAFVERLAAYDNRVTFWPADEYGLIDLDRWLAVPQVRVAIYCCGPGPLIEAVENRCASWPAGALHIERFAPKDGVDDGPREEFEVEFRRSGLTFTVRADETILDAAEERGVNLEMSCREGTCATCLVPVLEGMPDHRDSVLSEAEQDAGDSIIVCCSRALSPRLVLDA